MGSIKQTRGFGLHPNKHNRHYNQNNGVIITHMIDLIDKKRLTQADLVYDISDKCQFNEHFFYFKRDMGYEHKAYHMFFETYMNEIFGYMGCSLSNRSEYLQELVKKEILNPMYKDWFLLVFNGTFEVDICEMDMYSKAAYQLGGLMTYEAIKLDNMKYLGDIINKEKAEKSSFMFAPMTHFDRSIFKRELLRFKTK